MFDKIRFWDFISFYCEEYCQQSNIKYFYIDFLINHIMGKTYRNCTSMLIQIVKLPRLPEGHLKRRESTMNSSSLESMVSKTREKYGEFNLPSPSLERQPENSSHSSPMTQEGFSKVHFDEL